MRVNLDNWDPPDRPQGLPDPAPYDAASLVPLRHADGAATWQTIKCPACLQQYRHRAITHGHSRIWGECMRALPPPVALRPLGAVPASSRSPIDDELDVTEAVDFTADPATVVTAEPATEIVIEDSSKDLHIPADQATLHTAEPATTAVIEDLSGDPHVPADSATVHEFEGEKRDDVSAAEPEMALNLQPFDDEDPGSGSPGEGLSAFDRMIAPLTPTLSHSTPR